MVSVALIDSKAEGFAEGLGFCWGFGKPLQPCGPHSFSRA